MDLNFADFKNLEGEQQSAAFQNLDRIQKQILPYLAFDPDIEFVGMEFYKAKGGKVGKKPLGKWQGVQLPKLQLEAPPKFFGYALKPKGFHVVDIDEKQDVLKFGLALGLAPLGSSLETVERAIAAKWHTVKSQGGGIHIYTLCDDRAQRVLRGAAKIRVQLNGFEFCFDSRLPGKNLIMGAGSWVEFLGRGYEWIGDPLELSRRPLGVMDSRLLDAVEKSQFQKALPFGEVGVEVDTDPDTDTDPEGGKLEGSTPKDKTDPFEKLVTKFWKAERFSYEDRESYEPRLRAYAERVQLDIESKPEGERNAAFNSCVFYAYPYFDGLSIESDFERTVKEAARKAGLEQPEIKATYTSATRAAHQKIGPRKLEDRDFKTARPKSGAVIGKIDLPASTDTDPDPEGGKLEPKSVKAFDQNDHAGLCDWAETEGIFEGFYCVRTIPEKFFRMGDHGVFVDADPDLNFALLNFIKTRCKTTDREPRPFPSQKGTIQSLRFYLWNCLLPAKGRQFRDGAARVCEFGKWRKLEGCEYVTPEGVFNAFTETLNSNYFALRLDLGFVPKVGETPTFDAFCESVGSGPAWKIRLLECLGAALFGRLEGLPKILIHFFGEGGTGKSTIGKFWLQYATGGSDGGCNAVNSKAMESVFMKSAIYNGSIGVLDDCKKLSFLEEDILQAGSGEKKVETLDFKNKDPRNVETQLHLILISNNQALGLVDKGGRYTRRLCSLPFGKLEGDPDPNLQSKLNQETPEILGAALQAAKQLIRNKKPSPLPEDRELKTVIQCDSNPIQTFIHECLVIREDGEFLSAKQLFPHYRAWCQANFMRDNEITSLQSFGIRFGLEISKSIGFESTPKSRTKRERLFGLALKPSFPDTDPEG